MNVLRKMKALVVVFAVLALLAGAFAIVTPREAEARYGCCIWVMYCTQNPPIVCWCECIPVPCP